MAIIFNDDDDRKIITFSFRLIISTIAKLKNRTESCQYKFIINSFSTLLLSVTKMLFGSSEVPQKIEFISYSPEYREQTLDVIKNSFFKFETVSVASEINTNPAGQDDLIKLCEDALQRSNVSIIARDVEKNLIIGAALNVIQVSLIYIFYRRNILITYSTSLQGQRTRQRWPELLRTFSR